jgi:CRISPR-associated exonuclease Cas4
MSTLAWLVLVAVVVVTASIAWQRRGARNELALLPRELEGAELLYMEKSFRVNHPFPVVAKVDRVYRRTNGQLVLVELKTRKKNRVYLTDIIQLSAQRLVLSVQTGQPVSQTGFVCVQRPGIKMRWHRVQMLDTGAIVDIQARRMALLKGAIRPDYAASLSNCTNCAWRFRCDHWK